MGRKISWITKKRLTDEEFESQYKEIKEEIEDEEQKFKDNKQEFEKSRKEYYKILDNGFNLSNDYDIKVKMEEYECKLTIEHKKAYNLYNDKNIKNLTVLVGENGSGKTSYIKRLNIEFNLLTENKLNYETKKDKIKEYIDKMLEYRYLKMRDISETLDRIILYKDTNGICVYHNIEGLNIPDHIEIAGEYCSIKNPPPCIERTSIINVTNVYYIDRRIVGRNILNYDPKYISETADEYYLKSSFYNEYAAIEKYDIANDGIFQGFLDILYLEDRKDKETEDIIDKLKNINRYQPNITFGRWISKSNDYLYKLLLKDIKKAGKKGEKISLRDDILIAILLPIIDSLEKSKEVFNESLIKEIEEIRKSEGFKLASTNNTVLFSYTKIKDIMKINDLNKLRKKLAREMAPSEDVIEDKASVKDVIKNKYLSNINEILNIKGIKNKNEKILKYRNDKTQKLILLDGLDENIKELVVNIINELKDDEINIILENENIEDEAKLKEIMVSNISYNIWQIKNHFYGKTLISLRAKGGLVEYLYKCIELEDDDLLFRLDSKMYRKLILEIITLEYSENDKNTKDNENRINELLYYFKTKTYSELEELKTDICTDYINLMGMVIRSKLKSEAEAKYMTMESKYMIMETKSLKMKLEAHNLIVELLKTQPDNKEAIPYERKMDRKDLNKNLILDLIEFKITSEKFAGIKYILERGKELRDKQTHIKSKINEVDNNNYEILKSNDYNSKIDKIDDDEYIIKVISDLKDEFFENIENIENIPIYFDISENIKLIDDAFSKIKCTTNNYVRNIYNPNASNRIKKEMDSFKCIKDDTSISQYFTENVIQNLDKESNDYIYLKNAQNEIEGALKVKNFNEIGDSNDFELIKYIREQLEKGIPSFIVNNTRITLEPGISSGERALINMFSWIKSIPKLLNNNNTKLENIDNIILTIDEIDLYIHPEAQRLLMSQLISIINNDADFKNKNVQIILTTHSPIILSDIPNTNVRYLLSKGQKNVDNDELSNIPTFAQNIYTLFKNSFFLKRTTGAIAYDKLDSLIKEIEEAISDGSKECNDGLVEKAKNIINIIGEPLIKKILQNKLDQYIKKYENKSNSEKSGLIDRLLRVGVTEKDIKKLYEGVRE